MNRQKFQIKLVKAWPEDQIVNLYKAGGWWKDYYDSSKLKLLIKGSYAFAVAIEKESNKAIGMGRVISDGTSDAYIQDLVVLPEFRESGIGKKLVKKLLEFCLSKNLAWIGLIAEPNQNGFYSNIGFKILKNYTPMKYYKDD
ncbi:MAG: GCN5 family acetyltransferase [Thermoplasmatales archaeon SG8-52-3]|nr:MAG: GCN5 family acetyltransferase [Thermoplasmatales archaeon SG8-52-3]